jgi:hypothetical protein
MKRFHNMEDLMKQKPYKIQCLENKDYKDNEEEEHDDLNEEDEQDEEDEEDEWEDCNFFSVF